ncbi:MAG: AAA family ATPase, partial [Desulfococcaceae bacterium]
MTRHTNWYVITGAPCSGKTTVICELERMGYRVVHEAARAYIDSQLQKGRSMDNIRGNALEMQQAILCQKLKNEAHLPDTELIFLDRGIPDSIAYYHLSGLNAEEPVKHSRAVHYKKIFFFE